MSKRSSHPSIHAQEGGREPRFLAIARILKPQGRRGEVCAQILTDFPDRFHKLRRLYMENPGEPLCELTVESAWPHKQRIILKFSGVDSIDEAERLRGRYLLIPFEDRVPLADNSYYWSELCGCAVVTGSPGNWTEIGAVESVEANPGAALLHVARKDSRAELLIPLAQDICTRIDIGSKTIVITPPDDLLDLNS
ncbi:MAG: ribosome maturation factor RimM [Terriglobia bacterium]